MDNPIWSYIFGPPKEKKAIIDLLGSLPAFEGLSANELAQVDRSIHQRRYAAGEMVFGEGMPGAGMYIVKEGEVVIRKAIDDRKSIELAVVGERNFFGELALIDEMPRSAGAVATKETALLALGKPDLEAIMERNPRLGAKIISNIAQLICKRLVKANENLEIVQNRLNKHEGTSEIAGAQNGSWQDQG